MDIRTRSEWHVGGTRAPSRQAGGPLAVWVRRAVEAVPQRAISAFLEAPRSAWFCGCSEVEGSNGTEWHGGPRESIRDHRRLR